MTKELRQQKQIELAVAIAQGKSVDLWARDNHVPRSTAYRWAGQPDVRTTSETCRRRARKCALRKMANRAYWEAYHVAALARDAESESVKLRALRSILSGANAMSTLPVLKRRMSAIVEELHEPLENAGPSPTAVPCSLMETRVELAK
jgi:hypothetical protein